jgi:hypothetical protein
LLVPHAHANIARIPDELTDEQVVLLADIASTGISAAESAGLKIGDTAAVFAQGPIGILRGGGRTAKRSELRHRGRIRSGSCCHGEAHGLRIQPELLVRGAPKDHDYALSPANIRVMNRRDSYLDRDPRCFPSAEEGENGARS